MWRWPRPPSVRGTCSRTRPSASRPVRISGPGTRSPGGRGGHGQPVRRYGQVIGFATQDIAVGDHVHTQNLGVGDLSRRSLRDRRRREAGRVPIPPDQMRYFDGFQRADGRVGTRNYVAIISGVNCSASVSQFVKDRFRDVHAGLPERRRRHRHHPQVGLRHQALRRGSPRPAACAGRLRQAPQRGRLHPGRASAAR